MLPFYYGSLLIHDFMHAWMLLLKCHISEKQKCLWSSTCHHIFIKIFDFGSQTSREIIAICFHSVSRFAVHCDRNNPLVTNRPHYSSTSGRVRRHSRFHIHSWRPIYSNQFLRLFVPSWCSQVQSRYGLFYPLLYNNSPIGSIYACWWSYFSAWWESVVVL